MIQFVLNVGCNALAHHPAVVPPLMTCDQQPQRGGNQACAGVEWGKGGHDRTIFSPDSLAQARSFQP